MKPNTILAVIITIFLAAVAYWYFVVDSGNQSTLTTAATPSAAQAQFDTLVSELQPISFDTSIFSDPRFSALIDMTTPVSPEPVGRIDPLATFSSVLGLAPAQTAGATSSEAVSNMTASSSAAAFQTAGTKKAP